MVYAIIITRYLSCTRNYPTKQFFVQVLFHSVVQEDSVRIGIKGSWRLWFGKWVLYLVRPTKNIKVINSFYKGMHDMQEVPQVIILVD